MRYFVGLLFVFIVLMFPAIAVDESKEELESACDEAVSYSNLHISIAEVHERIVSMSWPEELPPLYRYARYNAYAVFQIKVSTSGNVCFIESIGGNPFFLSLLANEIEKWKFRQNRPFWGVIAIRSESGRFQLL